MNQRYFDSSLIVSCSSNSCLINPETSFLWLSYLNPFNDDKISRCLLCTPLSLTGKDRSGWKRHYNKNSLPWTQYVHDSRHTAMNLFTFYIFQGQSGNYWFVF